MSLRTRSNSAAVSSPPRGSARAPALLGLTVFTSAFLLFLVQPLIAKQILPWFGGSAAVWTTCLVFFQVTLLAGYSYAHAVTRLRLRAQVTLHGMLLVVSALTLPITVGHSWRPAPGQEPTLQIVGVLGTTIGLPYIMLSTTGPLVQAWFARTFVAHSVYRLFALSNLASLFALLAYPFLIEPWVAVEVQAWAWSSGYAVFAACCIASGVLTLRFVHAPDAPLVPTAPPSLDEPAAPSSRGTAGPAGGGSAPSALDAATWLLFAALGSWLLLAVTNHITQNIASMPFLWIAPLSLYLCTFILAFDREGCCRRTWLLAPLAVVVCAAAYGLHGTAVTLNIKLAIPLYLAALFAGGLFLHGEVAALRPAPGHLTGFYLMLALGGALGALGVGVVAPQVFAGYYELGLGLVMLAIVAAVVLRKAPIACAVAVVVAGVTTYYWYLQIADVRDHARVLTRNFYGILKTRDTDPEFRSDSVRQLVHGAILHGEQFLVSERRLEPTTYYGPTFGVGLAINHLLPLGPRRIGVIGLGTGTIAAWGRAGDVLRFYELNPQVIDLAEREFWYLREGPGRSETVLGDARLSLEREAPQQYDLIAIDAFSSDAIPVHLLTREAMAVYLRHLRPDGIVAFHVTNRFLNLAPVVRSVAESHGLHAVLVADEEGDGVSSRTDWALVSRDASRIRSGPIAGLIAEISPIPGLGVWTDDFNNLFRILK